MSEEAKLFALYGIERADDAQAFAITIGLVGAGLAYLGFAYTYLDGRCHTSCDIPFVLRFGLPAIALGILGVLIASAAGAVLRHVTLFRLEAELEFSTTRHGYRFPVYRRLHHAVISGRKGRGLLIGIQFSSMFCQIVLYLATFAFAIWSVLLGGWDKANLAGTIMIGLVIALEIAGILAITFHRLYRPNPDPILDRGMDSTDVKV